MENDRGMAGGGGWGGGRGERENDISIIFRENKVWMTKMHTYKLYWIEKYLKMTLVKLTMGWEWMVVPTYICTVPQMTLAIIKKPLI